MKYLIVEGDSTPVVQDAVNTMAKEGYQLHGDLTVLCEDGGYRFLQPMVKFETHFAMSKDPEGTGVASSVMCRGCGAIFNELGFSLCGKCREIRTGDKLPDGRMKRDYTNIDDCADCGEDMKGNLVDGEVCDKLMTMLETEELTKGQDDLVFNKIVEGFGLGYSALFVATYLMTEIKALEWLRS